MSAPKGLQLMFIVAIIHSSIFIISRLDLLSFLLLSGSSIYVFEATVAIRLQDRNSTFLNAKSSQAIDFFAN